MLLYHAVMDDPPGWIAEFTVTPAAFAAQLDAIEAAWPYGGPGRRPRGPSRGR